ncbi:MAG: PstS family phosphate ABC transporter substrate-binding protein [Gemmatimonadetes bacterium]|nr:PstS family phosphate ABC transporter substrate-binding protein [Gemmatimonadota bacterium]MXX70647.1 PstS family phosphate ABC transporter substrate-binding protein [Gemmatimonadota bacterium]MYC89980.1 PstS family phosphate ABC transporter substrate-binding protein [Gemmatimonadota bacterium]MYG35426.1 PstS family phosphate ABC transporter substrate-binding protein [Gemmatimonadota bacterium]
MTPLRPMPGAATAGLVVALSAGCGRDAPVVSVGGASSLYPLSEAIAEDFAGERPDARIAVVASGSAGGFRRLCAGEVDITGASRPISTAESERCRIAGIRYLGVPIARDGIAIVANRANTAVQCLTLDELRRLWEPSGAVATWRDLRPAYPSEEIRLFGPGPGSGTFDAFTRVVMGRPGASRADYYQTEADNLIAHGVAGNRWALGYFGSAAFAAHRDRLRTIEVDTGFGCVRPTDEAVSAGAYSPLSRDLYIYVAYSTLERADVFDFAHHYIVAAERLSALTGYVPLPSAEYVRSRALLAGARGAAP